MGCIKMPAKPRFLHCIPGNSMAVIVVLVAVNGIVWAAIGIILHFHPALISSAVLSYTLGLRHALDADHISAIDLVTRRLIASGQRPATVGTFFSLGHSTIVLVTCVVVAATSGALRNRFDGFSRVGNMIGTAVSAAVLILLCLGNAWVLYKLVGQLQAALAQRRRMGDDGISDDEPQGQLHLQASGLLARILGLLFKAIDRPWKMYPLGVVFGLGFDTSSEIAILGLASLEAIKGTSIWLILIFPVLFTSAMCLLDSTDGALMMALYTSKAFSRDVVALLYYSIVLTAGTVFVSAFVGIVQVLSLVQNVAQPDGRFWDGVSSLGDHSDIIGGCICGVFVLAGLGSVAVYRPWRRRVEPGRIELAQRRRLTADEASALENESAALSGSHDAPTRGLEG